MRDSKALTVNAGWAKGLKLMTPKGASTRPTSLKVRQAIFNMLQGELEGTTIADLYAGSGAIGIEALSRGAICCYFIDNDPLALKALHSNYAQLQARAQSQNIDIGPSKILRGSVEQVLASLPILDLIWADPPYLKALDCFTQLKSLLPLVTHESSTLMIEAHADVEKELPNEFTDGQNTPWQSIKNRTYGSTLIKAWRPNKTNKETS